MAGSIRLCALLLAEAPELYMAQVHWLLRSSAIFLLTTLAHAADPLWQIHNPSPPTIGTLVRAVVGADGRIAAPYEFSAGLAVSDDGVNWRWERTANPYSISTDILNANGIWMVVSSATNSPFGQTAICISSDLQNWTRTTIATPWPLSHITYGGGKYWGIQANGVTNLVYSSTDGTTWAPVAGHNLRASGTVYDLVYSTNFNVLVASVTDTFGGFTNRIITSQNGITWTDRVVRNDGSVVYDLHAANGVVMAVGAVGASPSTNAYRSVNGTTYDLVTVPGSSGGHPGVTFVATNHWVLLGNNSTVSRSTNNGVDWASAPATGYSGNGATVFQTVAYRPNDSRVYALGRQGFVASTTNFATPWTRVSKGTNASFNGLAIGLGRVVAVGSSTNLFLAAAGSTNWVVTNVPNGTFSTYERVLFLNDRFIALSGSTRSARSTDGINFSAVNMNAQVQRILWDGSQYIGTRDGFSNFLFSADAITWTTNTGTVVPFNRNGKLYPFAGKYVYVAQPLFGELAFGVTTDFTTWTTNNLLNYFGDFFYEIVEAGGNLYYPFNTGVLKSGDGLNWTILPQSGPWNPTEAGATVVSNRLYAIAGNPNTFRVIYSDTGTNWQPVAELLDRYPGGNSSFRMVYDGTRLVGVGQRGTLASVEIALSGAAATGNSFTSWRNQFTFPLGQDDETDDPDGDRVINIVEFAFGSNPTNAASGELPKAGTVSEGGMIYPSVAFIRNRNATGVTLDVTAATDVTFGSAVGVTQATGSPQDLGEGLERVIYRTTTPLDALPTVFFNIRLLSP